MLFERNMELDGYWYLQGSFPHLQWLMHSS